MNPLSRILGLALISVLVVLGGILGLAAWRDGAPRAEEPRVASADRSAADTPASQARQVARLTHRLGLALTALALVLAMALLVGVALHAPAKSTPPSTATASSLRTEMAGLSQLVGVSAAQREELHRERDGRQRAQEDLDLQQILATRALEEKIRIGRDLHDGVIQSLYATALMVESARPLVSTAPGEATDRLERCLQMLDTAIRDTRGYITGLSPETLKKKSFADAVAALTQMLKADRDVEFDLRIDDEAAAHLAGGQISGVLQFIREAASNALRHGAATRIVIRLHESDGEIALLVQDNGRGFDPAKVASGGHGMPNLHARAGLLAGELRLSSEHGAGTRVALTFPVVDPS